MSNRKLGFFILQVLLAVCLQRCHGQESSGACRVTQMSNNGGTISSDALSTWTPSCQIWTIRATTDRMLTIRVLFKVPFDQKACDSGTDLIIGPSPIVTACNDSQPHEPLMYRTKQKYVWIKYVTRLSPTGSRPPQFQLDVISSVSTRCGFWCGDGSCIPVTWMCNRQYECADYTDEASCGQNNTVTHAPKTTTAVVKDWLAQKGPMARAGPDMIVHLPTNRVTLYGNDSTGANPIIDYEWQKVTGGVVDMMDSRSPILLLSGLTEGVYTFCLTVTDNTLQSDSDYVHVYVRAGYVAPTTTRRPTTVQYPNCPKCFLYASNTYGCVPTSFFCDGNSDCQNGFDELVSNCAKYRPTPGPWHQTTARPTKVPCDYDEIYCYVAQYYRYQCLHNMFKCDGIKNCLNGEDEDPSMCGEKTCNRRLEDAVGWFASPNFPASYPANAHCSWVIHQQAASIGITIQLRVVSFSLEGMPNTDSVTVYDGPDSTYKVIGTYYGYSRPPVMIESTSSWMNVVFRSDAGDERTGFNFTYQIKGQCLSSQLSCKGERECYTPRERCNGVWDCPLKGSDELGCGKCGFDYTCGQLTNQCYYPSERCNGIAKCSNYADENNCTSTECGTHNGTFLCDNKRCIYEEWTCDGRDDCGDNSDEQFCSNTTKRVIIAAICGSMICALLLVILLGCSCKLYSLRTMDRTGHLRHETPMSRLYAELLRRRAPPPYHEAMLTSRNFDEVQQEHMERLRNAQRRSQRRRRGNGRRSSRNNQQTTDDAGTSGGNQNAENNSENTNICDTDGNNMQLSTVMEENENHVNIDRTSSTAELLPSDSETDSSDSEAGLDSDLEPDNEGQGHDGPRGQLVINDVADDDDDENILESDRLSSQWARSLDSDGDDDACILSSETSGPNEVMSLRGNCDNVSIDTEASASILSMDNQEINAEGIESKNSSEDEIDQNNSDVDEETVNNSRNSTPKPEGCHESALITDTEERFLMRGPSQNSLDSIGSETYSENDVPLLSMNSVSHF